MKQKSNGTHLILMELMFVLFFFAICGSILVQVFVKSHNISIKAREMTETTNYVTQAAELIEAGNDKIEPFKEYFSSINEKNGNYECYFNEAWEETTEDQAIYKMTIRLEKQDQNLTGKITMRKGKTQIYHLDILKHMQERKNNERT